MNFGDWITEDCGRIREATEEEIRLALIFWGDSDDEMET